MLPALFEILLGLLTSRQVSHLQQIITAILGMTGSVSMLSISRLSGIPYRTVQRFYAQNHDWNAIRFRLYQHFVPCPIVEKGEVIFVVDEVVEGKCGHKTFSIGWFYSGLYSKVIKGISILQISAVHTDTGNSYPLVAMQLQKNEDDEKRSLERKAKKLDLKKRKAEAKAAGIKFVGKPKGRKKGSKNKNKSSHQPVDAHDSLLFRHCKTLLAILMGFFQSHQGSSPRFLVGDGSFGNQYYVALAIHNKLHLISKLKRNAQIFLPFTGKRTPEQKGPNKKYGDLLDYKKLPIEYLLNSHTDIEAGIQTNTYQLKAYNKEVCKNLLNIVILEEVKLKTGKKSRVILFSTELEVMAHIIIHYYQLRFKIEIDFRDAKQYFGLRDFKNIKEQQVTNAIHMAITTKLVAQIRAEQLAQISKGGKCSILDVKTYYRAKYYLKRIIKLTPYSPEQFLSHDTILSIAKQESINLARAA